VSSKQKLSNSEFLQRVSEYLPEDATVLDTDLDGKSGACSPGELTGNTFYLMDAEAILAACHAIEDLALDEASGRMLASFQDFANFGSHRERYCQLAATVDEVIVAGTGKKPRPCKRLRFVSADGTALSSFWFVVYQGRRTQAMVLSRQTKETPRLENRSFFGFYTFDTRLIERARQDIDALLGGATPALTEFDRLHAIDQAARQIRAAFHSEQRVLETALHKMQFRRDRFKPEHFSAELDRSLQRLQRLTLHLPELFQDNLRIHD
jgi:hypothetical protein